MTRIDDINMRALLCARVQELKDVDTLQKIASLLLDSSRCSLSDREWRIPGDPADVFSFREIQCYDIDVEKDSEIA